MPFRPLTLAQLLFAATLCAQQPTSMPPAPVPPVSVRVDLSKPIGDYKPITAWFGYDELNYTTTPHGRQLLSELSSAYPVPVYIRAHHLFTSGDAKPDLKWSSTNIYTLGPDGKPVYDFHTIDRIFDAWRDAGVRPMIELGFMPEALASGTNPYHLPYPHTVEGSVQSPPKDYAAWGELCRTFTAHLVRRYGRDVVATWYFEIWNEPNIPYWHGTEAEYLKLYDFAVAGVRAALPEARVGGPATTSPRDQKAADYLDAFLQHIANDSSAANGKPVPLDFITFHAKGSPKLIPGPHGSSHVRMGLSAELTDVDKGFALIASNPRFKSLPIILSEADPEGCAACSAIENPANAYRNGPLYPAYTAATIKALFDLQDKHRVNLLGMLSWSFEFEDRKYFEGFRTLATNGIDKPVLNIFRMSGMMSGQRVATSSSASQPTNTLIASGVPDTLDVDALATLDTHTATVLLWNYRDDDLPNGPPASVQLEISGFPSGIHRAKLEHYRIDQNHSNAFTAWKSMGSPQSPTPAQLTELRAAGQLQLLETPSTVTIRDGQLTLTTQLPPQATSLLVLRW